MTTTLIKTKLPFTDQEIQQHHNYLTELASDNNNCALRRWVNEDSKELINEIFDFSELTVTELVILNKVLNDIDMGNYRS